MSSQSAITKKGSSFGLLPTLVKLAVRGSLKVRPILLTIALLIAINVAVHTMTNSYEKEVTSLMALYSGREYLTVSEKPLLESVKISVSPYTLGNTRILLIYSENVKMLLSLSGATVTGTFPVKEDEVLVGEAIKDLVEKGTVTLDGHGFRVTGYIKSNDHLTYSIVGVVELRSGSQQFYISSRQSREDSSFARAPAIQSVTSSLFSEVVTIMNSVRYLLYGVLALSCLFQGYNSLIEAKDTLRVFASLSTPKRMVNGSMLLYACLISLSGAVIGFSIGLFLSGLLSSTTSVLFRLPHLKPLVHLEIGADVALGVGASFPALLIGLVRGYSRQIASG